ncbi:MAG: transposase [Nannocystaceae bacterium]
MKHEHDLATSGTLHPGVLVVVQRFRSDLGLFVHLHCLVTDGCFEELAEGSARFVPTRAGLGLGLGLACCGLLRDRLDGPPRRMIVED